MNKIVLFMSAVFAISLTFGIAFAENPGAATPQSSIRSLDIPVIQVELRQGAGVDKTSILCNICHSLDYITMQPPFPRAQWTGTVNKMVKVLGAPINDDDAKIIIDYLSASYGNGK